MATEYQSNAFGQALASEKRLHNGEPSIARWRLLAPRWVALSVENHWQTAKVSAYTAGLISSQTIQERRASINEATPTIAMLPRRRGSRPPILIHPKPSRCIGR